MKPGALWYFLLALPLLLCFGCAGETTPAQPPSAVAPQPNPTAAPSASQPTAASQAAAEPSAYLWPSYLPANMSVSPPESRVASAHEVDASGLGFFVIVLNGKNQKLSIGGGNIKDTIPITGQERNITAGSRSGRLITNATQREIVFDVTRGKLFIYSVGISEEELLKVAGSLEPIDAQALREKVGK